MEEQTEWPLRPILVTVLFWVILASIVGGVLWGLYSITGGWTGVIGLLVTLLISRLSISIAFYSK